MKELTITERTTVMERSVKMAKEIFDHEGRPGVVYGMNGTYSGPDAVLETAKRIFNVIIDVPENKMSTADIAKALSNQ